MAGRAGLVLEKTMFGFVGSHFEILVLVGFGLFAVTLGTVSITDALARRS
jgi:hypothetical protein